MGIPEREVRKKGAEKILKVIMAKNFSKLMTLTKPQIQEAHSVLSRINNNKSTRRHIIFKLQKIKSKQKS